MGEGTEHGHGMCMCQPTTGFDGCTEPNLWPFLLLLTAGTGVVRCGAMPALNCGPLRVFPLLALLWQ